jgi:hypothetical protein
MYEGRGDGIVAWEKTDNVGVWAPAEHLNATVTERWDNDSNDWVHDQRPAKISVHPRHPLRRTAGEARTDSKALQDGAPRVTEGLLHALAAAGPGSALILAGGLLRVTSAEEGQVVCDYNEVAERSSSDFGWLAKDLLDYSVLFHI